MNMNTNFKYNNKTIDFILQNFSPINTFENIYDEENIYDLDENINNILDVEELSNNTYVFDIINRPPAILSIFSQINNNNENICEFKSLKRERRMACYNLEIQLNGRVIPNDNEPCQHYLSEDQDPDIIIKHTNILKTRKYI